MREPRFRTAGRIAWRVLESADRSSVPFMSSALAFDALLASIPFLLLLLVALTQLAGLPAQSPEADVAALFDRFLPATPFHEGGTDRFTVVKDLLARIAGHRGELSLVAVPTFLWFSTRLFSSVRTALNRVYHVTVAPLPPQHPIWGYLRGKLRDALLVLLTLVLFLANSGLTAALAVARARWAAQVPALAFVVDTAGRWLTVGLAFAFSVALFWVPYRYATTRRPSDRNALVAALFAAALYEVAKWVFGEYLRFAASVQLRLDANLGAVVLFVLWVYYTAFVFLVGGVLATTLHHRPGEP